MITTSQLEGNHSPWRELQTYNRSLTNCITSSCISITSQLGGNQSLEKTTDIHQVTDKLYHIGLYDHNLTTRRKSQSLERTTDIQQVTDKLYHIKLHQYNLTTRRKSVPRENYRHTSGH